MSSHKEEKFQPPVGKRERQMTKSVITGADGKDVKVAEINMKSGYKLRKMQEWKKAGRFPGRKPVNAQALEKYNRGSGVDAKQVRNRIKQHKIRQKEKKILKSQEEAARAEVLLTESSGLLEVEPGTYSSHITQRDLKKAVDITAATKSFDLKLIQFGPYKMDYTRNGRHLVLGGRKGHLAAFDWVTKKLSFEINVMESIHDVSWLHTEQMVAVAQKRWVYIYDNQGIELHCLKKLHNVLNLEFLPYHFLLASGHESGFLSWIDVTLGKEVLQYPTRKGRIEVMAQNPFNAVLCCGHPNGTVTMWTPNHKESAATIFCHSQPVRAVAFDPAGRYMATAATDRQVKIWDARQLGGCLYGYQVPEGASRLAFSQKRLLGVAMGNVVQVYRDVTTGQGQAYMEERGSAGGGIVTGMQFCPYEDVLGISTYSGFSSLLIPGSGEPNFDALEANPYISKSGRREAEVKSVLNKIPSNLIALDPLSITQVDTPTLENKLKAKLDLLHVKPPKVDTEPRYRMKGKSGSAAKFKRKQLISRDAKRGFIEDALKTRKEREVGKQKKQKENDNILDRFNSKH